MATEQETKLIIGAINNIEDAIAGINTIKCALGMTEETHMEHDLKASKRRLEAVIKGE